MYIETLGYIASGLIVISLVMTSQRNLRYINAIGCSIYVFYGFYIDSYPILIMNSLCVGINIYNLALTKPKQ